MGLYVYYVYSMNSVSGSLFDSDDTSDTSPTFDANLPDGTRTLLDARADELWLPLKQRFGERLYLGTSSWSFPGWAGLVWQRGQRLTESQLSRDGLSQYAAQALLRCVSLDRTFYRAANLAQYERLARQVPDDFRFLVKAPAEITDAVLRDPDSGAPLHDNPRFLDGRVALDSVVLPAARGLGPRLGALVFQLSPLPRRWLEDPVGLMQRLDLLWRQVVPELPDGAVAALELRDAPMLMPELFDRLAMAGVRYCVGLHDRMPDAASQVVSMQRAGAGDFVCRWNLHQGLRYRDAKARWDPFDTMQAPDPTTREALARAVLAALMEGYRAFVTINNKAEGSAPLSVVALAEEILRQAQAASA